MLDDIKKTLWATADKLRANMDTAEYKHLVLGLIFVKYISDTEKRINAHAVRNSSTRLAKPADVLIASAGQGLTRGQMSYCTVETYINQSVVALPLVLIELKNPADLNADVWKAFDQIQTYKEQIADAFQYNEVLVISDGTDALLGSLSADPERFMAWRTIDGVTLDPLGPFNELQTLVRGVLAPSTRCCPSAATSSSSPTRRTAATRHCCARTSTAPRKRSGWRSATRTRRTRCAW